MTATAILDIKQRLSKLSDADRRMVSAYLLRLKHESRPLPAWLIFNVRQR